MPILEGIAAANEVLDFSKKIGELLSAEPTQKKRLKPIVRALSAIYFTPNGLVRALKQLASGDEPKNADVQAALLEFNQIEPTVHEAVRTLSFDSLANSGLSLRQRRVLDEVAYGKLSLRSDLQMALNESLTFGRKVDLDEVKSLIQRVETLNKAIEDLEESLH